MLGLMLFCLSYFLYKMRDIKTFNMDSPDVQHNSFSQIALEKSMLEKPLKMHHNNNKRDNLTESISFMLLTYHTFILLCTTCFIKLIIKNMLLSDSMALNHKGHTVFYKLFYIFFQNKIMLDLNKKIMMLQYGNNINVMKVCNLLGDDIKNNIGR